MPVMRGMERLEYPEWVECGQLFRASDRCRGMYRNTPVDALPNPMYCERQRRAPAVVVLEPKRRCNRDSDRWNVALHPIYGTREMRQLLLSATAGLTTRLRLQMRGMLVMTTSAALDLSNRR